MYRAILALFALSFVGTVTLPAQQAQASPEVIAKGKQLYEEQGCAKCHQIDGVGARLSVLDGVGDKLTAEELKMWLTAPDEMAAKLERRPMVPMPKVNLEDPDLDAIVAYLQTLKKN